MRPPIPLNDASRIAALRAYEILDTGEEAIFDSITRAAADACCAPMASISFIDSDRQWFKSTYGFEAKEISRDVSFGGHAINGQDLFVVEDTTEDPRFRDNPRVTGKPYLRFYAAVPLMCSDGLAIGTLCVFDFLTRSLTPEQTNDLDRLAKSAMGILNLRRNLGANVYAKAVDLASDGVTIGTPSAGGLVIIHANKSFLQFTGFRYQEVIGQPCTFPTPDCSGAACALEQAISNNQTTTVECQFNNDSGDTMWDRISFVPYVDKHNELMYVVAVHYDVSCQRDADMEAQQLHAMRTTLASVEHVVKNFMNAAQLYSLQVTSGKTPDANTQDAFDAALNSTRAQLAAIGSMPAFKSRATSFGVSLLDPEDRD